MNTTQTAPTPLNIKKIALIVTGLVAVVALGIFLGRGNLFKGSFIGAESDAIPVPTNVKITQDANKKFVLSWDYDKDAEAKSFLTFKDAASADIHAAAFSWNINDVVTGLSIGSDDAVKDVSPILEEVCNVKLSDDGMREMIDGYICHAVLLNDTIGAELAKGNGNIIKVQAYTGVTALTDPVDPQLYVRQISKAGFGEYKMPVAPTITPVNPLDTVAFNGVDPVTGVPQFIDYGWNDASYRAGNTNSKFADHDASYFGFGWEITDVTITGEAKVVLKKDVFGDPGTLAFPIGGSIIPIGMSPFTSEAAAKQTCLMNPSGFTGKIWTCKTGYIPAVEGFIDGHAYVASVSVYNGMTDMDSNFVASAPKSSKVFVVKATPAKPADFVTFNEADPVTGVPKIINWGYDTSAANKSNSKFADNFKSYFGFGWEITDVTITGEAPVIFKKDVFGDPGTMLPSTSSPFTSEASARTACAVAPSNFDGTIWTCNKAYVPDVRGYIDGHSYKATVKAYNGLRDVAGNLVPSAAVSSGKFTIKGTPAKSVDYAIFTEVDPVTGVPHFIEWGYNTSAANTSNSKFADNFKSYFGFGWEITDVTITGEAKVVLKKDVFGDPGTLAFPSSSNPFTSEAMARNTCMVNPKGYSPGGIWTCDRAYIPALKNGFIDGHSYKATVIAYNGLRDAYGLDVGSAPVTTNTFTVKATKVEVVADSSSDTTAPKVVSATSVTPNQVKVVFSEKVKLPAVPESAFSIKDKDGVIVKVSSVTVDPSDATGMTVLLVTDDQKGNPGYIITVAKDVVDLAGNPIDTSSNRAEYAVPLTPVVIPVPPVIPPTMTLKNLSVKKLTDGNVALTYTIDLAGKWTATEFSSEVRLNDSKIFVAKFNESSLTHMLRPTTAGPTTSYTYEAILLPWEIKAGDTLKVFMNANGLNANDYINDGQSVVYDAGAKILDAVVGLVTANALPSATVGSPYSTAIVVKDGVAPYKYIVSAGSLLPDGLSLDPLTGVLSGTPTKDNSFAFGLSITDAKNAALNATFTLKVVPAPVAGTVAPAGGGITIINNYTTYNPVAPVVPGTPELPSAPPSNRYLFPINLGPSLFQDVAYHWARNYINVLWNAGFVQGYTGRTFGPDDSLTRGQLLKIVMESLHYKLPTKVAYSPCVDVQTNQWYAKYFAVAREKGIIGGYVDGTCRPNKITNRAESLKILYAAIAQMPEVPVTRITATVPAGYRNTFYDLNEHSWYYPYFANAQSLGIINGFADETARPDSELSRAQMAKIVVLMMQKLAWAQ